VLRWRYLILALLAAVVALLGSSPATDDDWSYFMWGSRLLFGNHPPWALEPGGFHLYANYEAQIGPLTLAFTALLRALWGPIGSHTASIVFMTAIGPALVYVLERAAIAVSPEDQHDAEFRQWTVLLGGLVFIVAWGDLTAFFVHVDDAFTLVFACLAMWAVACKRPATTGVMIGLAAAAKPWGIVALPLVLVFHSRARWRAIAGVGAVLAVTWLPFVLVDPGTLAAGAPVAPTSRRSILHLVGFDIGSTPDGIRAVQLGAALMVGVLAVRRGRWAAVLLVGVIVRVLLDPAVYGYYMTGVLVAAFAWELLRSRRPLPVMTMGLSWVLFISTISLHRSTPEAVLRLVAGTATIAVALVASCRRVETTPSSDGIARGS
jgi:hypothetical protein